MIACALERRLARSVQSSKPTRLLTLSFSFCSHQLSYPPLQLSEDCVRWAAHEKRRNESLPLEKAVLSFNYKDNRTCCDAT